MKITTYSLFATVAVSAAVWAGIDRGGITLGIVDNTDPLTVAGVEFDTTATQVYNSGIEVPLQALRAGQVVQVRSGPGNSDSLPATSIDMTPAIRGTVEFTTASTAVVLGQAVDMSSIAHDARPVAGNFVSVHGFFLDDGSVEAQAIDADTHKRGSTVTGLVDFGAPGIMQINGLTAFTALAEFRGPAPGAGELVRISGLELAPGIFLAEEVQNAGILATAAPGEDVVLSGYVTQDEPGDFRINHTRVVGYSSDDDDSDDTEGLITIHGVVNANGTAIIVNNNDN